MHSYIGIAFSMLWRYPKAHVSAEHQATLRVKRRKGAENDYYQR